MGALQLPLSCIELSLDATSQDEALRHLAALLRRSGFVGAGFEEAICAREINYPTALAFEGMALAIPHTEPEFSKQSALAIGRCPHKPIFKSMENPDQELAVDAVVMLAMCDPEEHLKVLANLIGLFSNKDNVAAFFAATSAKDLQALFARVLYGERGDS